MRKSLARTSLFLIALAPTLTLPAQQALQPFRDTTLSADKRIDNLLSQMTLDEKIDALGTNTAVPRLGVPNFGSSEGIHGVVQRGGGKAERSVIPTTQFPQPPGMGESWDPDLVRQAAGVEGYEARYITQTAKYDRQILMLWGPQSDLARDPRWGRSEEVYGEDPFFNGTMVVSFIKGLQGDDPKYWQSAALLKHFLANSNEDHRTNSNSALRRAAVLGVLLRPLPHGLSRRRRQGRHGLLQRLERHADGRQSHPEEPSSSTSGAST